MKKLIILILVGLVGSNTGHAKPNILFIFADDLSYKTAGFNGNDVVKTPNLDRIAAQGTVFEKAYNMGSWVPAVCHSSRTMLNTGKFLWRSKEVEQAYNAGKVTRQIASQLWARRMQQAGYNTYMTGKWHVDVPAALVFDSIGTERAGMPLQKNRRYLRSFDPQQDSWSPYDQTMGGYWQGGKHWSEVQADEAIDFLRHYQDDKPFFVYLAFNAPHDPRQAPKKYQDLYPISTLSLPENFIPRPNSELMEAMGIKRKAETPKVISPAFPLGTLLRDEALAPYPRTEYSVKVNRQEYYAAISHMDKQIGRVVAQLKQRGELDNTLIIFTADHGLAIGEHGLMGKQNMYEHSLAAPLFLTGPGIPKGKIRKQLIYLQDAMATSLEVAEADLDGIEFKSLLPLVNDARKTSYSSIYGAYMNFQRAIIKDNLKLILYPDNKKVALFDLQQDPNEIRNLAGQPEHWNKVRQLFNLLIAKQKDMGDTLDLVTSYPELLSQK
ncbi:sulfatase-like hydrolase/transferase [Alteromonas sp. 14N.309.X.WAT.G.H12]|uniref:sulfatase-like hydrolase/transferase n=1 Tax=Alteromonas sp. 14N.309.X.WAT.G.H12 TaxID=3120824 RepID=UPI002FD53FB6